MVDLSSSQTVNVYQRLNPSDNGSDSSNVQGILSLEMVSSERQGSGVAFLKRTGGDDQLGARRWKPNMFFLGVFLQVIMG
jgi:hypothetical protein